MRGGWQAPLIALTVVILFAAFKAETITSAADVAAWVQGVGSLLAVGAAVWIYAKQLADKRKDDEAETRAFVQAMRTEIGVVWREYADVRKVLHTETPNGVYSGIVALEADSLIVYYRNPERVAKIDDEALRDLIVSTYTSLRHLINGLRQHKAFVLDYEEFYALQKGDESGPVYQRKYATMRQHTNSLRGADRDLAELIEKFMADTDLWLRRVDSR